MGGFDSTQSLNDVWSSSDGINWTQVTKHAQWAIRAAMPAVVFKNKFIYAAIV